MVLTTPIAHEEAKQETAVAADTRPSALRQIPNVLTSSRIGLALAFPAVDEGARLPILIAALATEYLDGALSRRFQWQTQLGKILDPIADKIFFLAVISTYLVEGKVAPGELLLLAIRDIAVFAGTTVALIRSRSGWTRYMRPMIFGKLTTVLQYGAFFSLVLRSSLTPVFLYSTAAAGVLAALQYGRAYLRKPEA